MLIIKDVVDGYMASRLGSDVMNSWGLVPDSYVFDESNLVVEIEATARPADRMDKLIEDFFCLLKEQGDDLLLLLDGDISASVVEEFNSEFLEEYFTDIIIAAEKTTVLRWNIFLMEEGINDFPDIKFVYNFSFMDIVLDEEKIMKQKTIEGVL